jgi:hypothetical protein
MEAKTLKMTSTPYYSMPLLQPFQNIGRFKVVATFEPIGGFGWNFVWR